MSTIPYIDPSIDTIERARAAFAKIGEQGIPLGPGLLFDPVNRWTYLDPAAAGGGGGTGDGGTSSWFAGSLTVDGRFDLVEQFIFGGMTSPLPISLITDALGGNGILRYFIGIGGTFSTPNFNSVLGLYLSIKSFSTQGGVSWDSGFAAAWSNNANTNILRVSTGSTYGPGLVLGRNFSFQFFTPTSTFWQNVPATYSDAHMMALCLQVAELCQTMSMLIEDLKTKGVIQ